MMSAIATDQKTVPSKGRRTSIIYLALIIMCIFSAGCSLALSASSGRLGYRHINLYFVTSMTETFVNLYPCLLS